jgi:Amt family ammonium transporter
MLDLERKFITTPQLPTKQLLTMLSQANGWLYKLPSLDFAGGGPVHIASGWAALAYAFVLGKRLPKDDKFHGKAHNPTLVCIGTVFIWFGWFGFNGGSALNGTMRSMVAAFNTNTAASFGVLGWCAVEYVRTRGKFSVVGACSGAIAGLVGITPAAGYVSVWPAAFIGFTTAAICSLCQNVDKWMRIDEGLDVFKLHGIGGMVGSFLTGCFAQSWVWDLDGMGPYGPAGAMDGVGVQVGRQLAEITAIASYSFVVSCALLFILKYIPGMHLRVSSEAEMLGLDADQFYEEQIGDWSLMEQLHAHGLDINSSSSSQAPPIVRVATKEA